ncbi:MAG: hypothetical protein ACREDE_10635, partial [Thermoplasmata archaeon]
MAEKAMPTEPPPRAADDDQNRPRSRPRGWALGALAAILVLTLAVVPLGAASGTPQARGAAMTALDPTPVASVAWGAAENLSIHLAYVGAYTSGLNLSGGNLTSTGAFVAVNESLAAGYLSYALLHVTEPSSSTRSVEVAALEIRSTVGAIGIAGTLPVAGTYAPGAVVPLENTSSALWLSEQVADATIAFANYTVGPNGSLALTDEQLRSWEAINVSLRADTFPNSTLDANGSTTLRYVTASLAEVGRVGENVSASFSPALLVSSPPLSVGK